MKNKKINVRKPSLTRQRLANPFLDIPIKKRLNKKIKYKFISLGNGYSKRVPIEEKDIK